MSFFLTRFFHDYGLTNTCLTKSLLSLHEPERFRHKNNNLIKYLSCLPILRQIIGAMEIKFGCEGLKSKFYPEKVVAASLLCRGILTFLGLGIICLLIDIIITCATLTKNQINK